MNATAGSSFLDMEFAPVVRNMNVCRKSRRCHNSRLAAVLLVTDLFHPVDRLAVVLLLDRDMGHGRCRRGAMPVLDAGRSPDNVARPDLLDRTAPLLHPADACGHDQNLAERMCMPGAASAGLESDGAARRASRIARRKEWIDPHGAGEPLGRSLR